MTCQHVRQNPGTTFVYCASTKHPERTIDVQGVKCGKCAIGDNNIHIVKEERAKKECPHHSQYRG